MRFMIVSWLVDLAGEYMYYMFVFRRKFEKVVYIKMIFWRGERGVVSSYTSNENRVRR
jgi:hypothetical protein